MGQSSNKKSIENSKVKSLRANKLPANSFSTQDILPLLLISLYVFTGVVPAFGSGDVMGSQWLYLTLLNIGGTLFIIKSRNSYYEALAHVIKSKLAIIYLLLLVIVGISFFSAINKPEFYINFARFFNTLVAFFIVSVLLFKRLHLFRIVAFLITVILFYESATIVPTRFV